MRTLRLCVFAVGVPVFLFQLHPAAGITALAVSIGYVFMRRAGQTSEQPSSVLSD